MTKKVLTLIVAVLVVVVAVAVYLLLAKSSSQDAKNSENQTSGNDTRNTDQSQDNQATIFLEGEYAKSTNSDGSTDIYYPKDWFFYKEIEGSQPDYSLLCEQNQEPLGHEPIGYCMTIAYDVEALEIPDKVFESYAVEKQPASSFKLDGYEGTKTLATVQYDSRKDYKIYYEFRINGKNLKIVASGPESTFEGKEEITDQIVKSIVIKP